MPLQFCSQRTEEAKSQGNAECCRYLTALWHVFCTEMAMIPSIILQKSRYQQRGVKWLTARRQVIHRRASILTNQSRPEAVDAKADPFHPRQNLNPAAVHGKLPAGAPVLRGEDLNVLSHRPNLLNFGPGLVAKDLNWGCSLPVFGATTSTHHM